MKTKFFLLIAVAAITTSQSLAQTETTATDTTQKASAQQPDSVQSSSRIHYTAAELLAKGKLDLTNIYLNQVQMLNKALPYAAFPIKGQATNVNKLDIPVSNYTDNKRMHVTKKGEKYNETIEGSLYEIIPYSDKTDIAKAILFIQEMVDRLDRGL